MCNCWSWSQRAEEKGVARVGTINGSIKVKDMVREWVSP